MELESMIDQTKERIKSALEFYFKYKNKPKKFLCDYPKKYKSLYSYFKDNLHKLRLKQINKEIKWLSPNEDEEPIDDFVLEFNDWLLRYAFRGVFE